jgi:hypothetical protein
MAMSSAGRFSIFKWQTYGRPMFLGDEFHLVRLRVKPVFHNEPTGFGVDDAIPSSVGKKPDIPTPRPYRFHNAWNSWKRSL